MSTNLQTEVKTKFRPIHLLLGIFVVLGLLEQIYGIYNFYSKFFAERDFVRANYSYDIAEYVISLKYFEFTFTIMLFIASIIMIFLFFYKRRSFILYYTLFLIAALVIKVFDYTVIMQLISKLLEIDPPIIKISLFTKELIQCIIFIPYLQYCRIKGIAFINKSFYHQPSGPLHYFYF